ncbi:hypothetical protein NKI07_08010 [Mesorhizobium sp. M0859]
MANEVRDAFNAVYADGPTSSPTQPPKSEIRPLGSVIDTQIAAVQTSTLAAVQAITDPLSSEVVELGDRVDDVEALALSGVKPAKQSVRLLVTTATAPSAMTAGATLDGLVLAAGDRVACATVAGAAADGVYVVQASGAAIRATDMDTAGELVGARFDVDVGTSSGTTWSLQTLAPITVDTTSLLFVRTTSAGALAGTVAALTTEVAAIAETVSGGDNAGAAAVLQVGGAVVGAVTPEGQFRFMTPLHPDDIPGASSEGATAYADGSKYLVSPNEMWSQWVWPRTIEDDNGNQMWGSLGRQQGPFTANGTGLVGRAGQLWIGYREAFAANAKKVMIGLSEESTGVYAARGGVDDHDRPAICLNPNPAAVYPLVAFQCDHNAKQYGRFWRSTTRNPADLTLVGQTPVNGSEYPAYAQLFWNRANPAELRGAYRIGLFDIGTWSFFVGDPGTLPSTWTYHYNKVGGDGTYFLTIPALDGSGMWLASHRHPTVAGSKRVTLAKLKWDWSLVSGNGTVISADIRAEASPVDILNHANVTVIDTMTGTRLTRLVDAREYSDGKIRFLYADFPTQEVTHRSRFRRRSTREGEEDREGANHEKQLNAHAGEPG